MPDPIPLRPELTDAALRARRRAQLDRLAELNMEVAELAATQIRTPDAEARDNPGLALSRATAAVIHIAAMEARLMAGIDKPARAAGRSTPGFAPAADPRRLLLRQILLKEADREPDRAARADLRRLVNDRIDEELRDDPDAERPIADALFNIGDDLGLNLDPSKLPDEVLGLRPPHRPANDTNYADRPALWAPTYVPDPDPTNTS